MLNSNLENKINLIGIPFEDFRSKIVDNIIGADKWPLYRFKQIWKWVYVKGESDFSKFSDLSLSVRDELSSKFILSRPIVETEQISIDGTIKWVLRLETPANQKPHLIETVYIPEDDRGTLCVSSQIGCTLNCKFCHTGTQKWVRNLTPEEIIGQVMLAKDRLGDWPNQATPLDLSIFPSGENKLTNIVFMGMGEPLYNTENVINSVKMLIDKDTLDFSRRRVTVSTSGIVPEIEKLGSETRAMLAISLHATTDELRDQIMPINKKYPLEQLLNACRNYPEISNARRITFEYVMLKGINDSDEDARRLLSILEGIPSKINLIPFNPWPNTIYEPSSKTRIAKFADIVAEGGFPSPVRRPRGQDIMAACGQLKSATEKLKKSDLLKV